MIWDKGFHIWLKIYSNYVLLNVTIIDHYAAIFLLRLPYDDIHSVSTDLSYLSYKLDENLLSPCLAWLSIILQLRKVDGSLYTFYYLCSPSAVNSERQLT